MASEKRVRFTSGWLPYALIFPQLLITIVFFFWPAGQALIQSLLVEDAFGASTEFVWFDNFRELFNDQNYLASFKVTAIFSVLVAGIGLTVSLVLAAFADRVLRGATFYKTLLIWPYAVAPAIAAVLWLFLFNPTLGILAHWMRGFGIAWNPLLDGDDALIMVVIAAVWKQISYNFLFFLAGLQSIPKSLIEAAYDAGATGFQTLVNVIIPLAKPGIVIGSIFVITIVMGDFITIGVMGGQQIAAAGKIIETRVNALQFPAAAANAVILLIITFLIITMMSRIVDIKKEL